jgi:hypothetical protein
MRGTAAHNFQLVMPAQVTVVAFFAIKRLQRTPRQTSEEIYEH